MSTLGTQATVLALPLTGALVLGSSASQMGGLTAAQYLPALVFGLPAGLERG